MTMIVAQKTYNQITKKKITHMKHFFIYYMSLTISEYPA